MNRECIYFNSIRYFYPQTCYNHLRGCYMKIKKLTKKELPDSYLISAYCFHMRIEDIEAGRKGAESEYEKIKAGRYKDWGAFDEDGKLMAHIINHRFSFYLDGKEVPAGGIGGVSTLPEYRDKGAVREIFKKLLPDAYKTGEVISALFPFKHSFYRRSGYEVITYLNGYTFAPSVLSGYSFDGEIRRWNNGDPVTDHLEIYRAFASKCNLAMVRDEERMLEALKTDKPYMDRKFSYVFCRDGKPVSYIIFTDIRHDPAAILDVNECAWTCRDGFYAILGFLARFEADYGEIRLPLPTGIDLLRIIQSPGAYDIRKDTAQSFMLRVINAKKLFELMDKPAGCDFTVRVTDEHIKENNGTFRVKETGVEESIVKKPDIELDIRALSQLAAGALNIDEAMLRRDVTVNGGEDRLRRVFTEKKICIFDHF